MANCTYDMMWQAAMAEVNEQIYLEDHTKMLSEDQDDGYVPPAQPPPTSILESFQYLAGLYIKYLQIFQKLEASYDGMVHPQKRIDVKQVLEVVMIRIVELKHLLVKWNPPNPDCIEATERNFPWEYVNLDDILSDLKLPPDTLEVTVPRYFTEDNAEHIRNRERMVMGYMNLKLECHKVFVEDDKKEDDELFEEMSLAEAIKCIQRNERGRQGKQRAMLVLEIREDEKNRRNFDSAPAVELHPEVAASNIQRLFRGFHTRTAAQAERDDELIFIGMKPSRHQNDELEDDLEQARLRRKHEQKENREAYEKALVDLRDVVKDEEGPDMREGMMEDRRNWFTQEMVTGEVPETLEGFYLMKNPPPEEEKKEEETDKKGKKGGKKDDKKKDDKKKGKGKKGKKEKEPEAPPEVPPPIGVGSELVNRMGTGVDMFEDRWLDRNEDDNFAQKHDVSLAKEKIRPSVEDEVRKHVDDLLVLQLKKIKTQLEAAAAQGKKGKKGKKGKGKKGKGKKGKGKKGKGPKGKKVKPLPGAKIAELKNMGTDYMLSLLVENKVVNNYHNIHVKDLIGDFNYLGTMYQHSERRDRYGNWIPQDPSIAQVRQLITEYAVLPNGVSNMSTLKALKTKEKNLLVRSILLYGPGGCGKTMMAQAIANEIGALFLNLSPSNLMSDNGQWKFPGKQGPVKLMHMAFTVARDPGMASCVIYIDNVHEMLSGGGKKKASNDGPSRFKDMLKKYTESLTEEDRVIVIGSTSEPEKGDLKDMRAVFDKYIYMPCPDYSSRVMLWKKCIEKQLQSAHLPEGFLRPELPDDFDMSTLAQVSEGFSAGAISKTVRNTLTERRVERLEKRPLTESEFVPSLSRCDAITAADTTRFKDFTAVISGLKDRREKIRSEKEDKGGDGKDAKKKGGKKKK